MSSNRTIVFIIFHVVLPLIVGCGVYIIFRAEKLTLDSSNSLILVYSIFIYSVSDGCWLYALLSSLILIWKNQSEYWFQFWIALSFISSIGTEILQLKNIIPGTYDLFDIIFYSVAFILFIIINKIQFIKNKKVSL